MPDLVLDRRVSLSCRGDLRVEHLLFPMSKTAFGSAFSVMTSAAVGPSGLQHHLVKRWSPIGCRIGLLVSIGGAKNSCVTVNRADDLDAHRQTAVREPARDGDGGLAREAERKCRQ